MEFSRTASRYLSGWRARQPRRIGIETEAADADLGPDTRAVEDVTQGGGEPTRPTGPETQEEVGKVDDERMQVLRMVEQHKITAEEAARLLATLEPSGKVGGLPAPSSARWLRVRVTDMTTGRAKVNVNVPLGVVTAAVGLGARFGLGKLAEKEGFNLEEVIEAIRGGAEGKLVDVTDSEEREHVEVFVE